MANKTIAEQTEVAGMTSASFSHENTVYLAAKRLAEAITAAEAAGYQVKSPFTISHLGMVSVSATAKTA